MVVRPHSPDVSRKIIVLVRAGRDPDDLARKFEPTAQSIRAWVVKGDKKDGRGHGWHH